MSDSVSCTAGAATRLLPLVSAVRAFSFVPLANLNGHGPTSGGVLSPGDLSRENIEAQGRRGRQHGHCRSSAAAPRGAALAHSGHRRRAGHQNRVNNPFDDPSSEIATPFDDPTPTGPDRWVQEEFEVETGRVVHQETIEGEPPDTESRASPEG